MKARPSLRVCGGGKMKYLKHLIENGKYDMIVYGINHVEWASSDAKSWGHAGTDGSIHENEFDIKFEHQTYRLELYDIEKTRDGEDWTVDYYCRLEGKELDISYEEYLKFKGLIIALSSYYKGIRNTKELVMDIIITFNQ